MTLILVHIPAVARCWLLVCVAWLACVSVCVSVSLWSMTVDPAEMAEPTEMPFWGQTHGGTGNYYYTLAPPGEYGGLICEVVAMQAVATVTVAVCVSKCSLTVQIYWYWYRYSQLIWR